MSLTPSLLPRSYTIHGIGLELRADEPAVVEAIALRLRGFDGAPDPAPALTLEYAATASPPPPPRGYGRPVYDTPHGSLEYFPEDDVVYGMLGQVSLHCAAGAGVASFASPCFRGRELYLATHPLLTISLMELLKRRGLYSLHAACLTAAEDRGILLAGPSGAGKSTLALALARAGAGFLSDDVVFLVSATGGVRALGFADTVGLSEHASRSFVELEYQLTDPPQNGFPKQLARPEELLDLTPVTSCHPRALVFPRVAGQASSRLRVLDPGEALVRLTPDVLLTHPAAAQDHLDALGALLDQVRCFTLDCGRDLDEAVSLVGSLA